METKPMIDQNLSAAPVTPPNTSLAPRAANPPAPRPSGRPQVVVVGAGFGGLHVAGKLAHADVDVLVLDRNNYHGFWPLLYQVATAGLDPASIAYPARAILRRYPNTQFLMAEVSGVDFERKLVLSGDKALPYDYLVLAAGSANNYFGNTAVGYTLGRRFVGGGVANGVFPLTGTTFMPVTQNAGWKLFNERP